MCADDEVTGGEDVQFRHLGSMQVIIHKLEACECAFAVTDELLWVNGVSKFKISWYKLEELPSAHHSLHFAKGRLIPITNHGVTNGITRKCTSVSNTALDTRDGR